MNFGLDLNLHVGLEQKLSPQMIQSLKLLQMNSLELEMVVKQELETNPMLEVVEDIDDEPVAKEDVKIEDAEPLADGDKPRELEPAPVNEFPDVEPPEPTPPG